MKISYHIQNRKWETSESKYADWVLATVQFLEEKERFEELQCDRVVFTITTDGRLKELK